ncbi:transporter substrate-binding domain-containing protein [Croceicoccus mobilis]|nr:transporter substrate-binding domain-containing protein [Croceicoccus mobilis]
MTMKRPWLRLLALLALLLPVLSTPAFAQDPPSSDSSGDTMIVATREAPPFAMRTADGKWEGLAIGLWDEIAQKEGYDYRLVEADLSDMIDGLPRGEYDASVGALTITAEREKQVDFTHAFHSTGFGIAVKSGGPDWLSLLASFFSMSFLMGLAPLILVLGFVGFLFWMAERRRNEEEFPRDIRGLGSGFWFSAVTMTTVGYGDKAPRTPAGKIVALVWMFAALLITSTFTGMLASSLTAGRLGGEISSPADLLDKKVGVIGDSAAEQWLAQDGIASDASFDDASAGLAALEDGEIDAFVHDDPLLRYLLRKSDLGDVRLLPGSFGRQDYGIALPPGSPLRETIDRDLLEQIEGEEWKGMLTRALGDGS